MKKYPWSAFILIGLGIYLLLDQLNLIHLSGRDLLTYGFILLGIILFFNGVSRPDKKGVLGGTFFLAFGLILTLMRSQVLVRDDTFGFATFFLSLALGNLMYFVFKPERWINFTWGLIFGAVGGLLLLAYYNYYPDWYIYDQLDKYWPLALIAIGVTILRG